MMVSYIFGHPVAKAPDDVLLRGLATMPKPSDAAVRSYDYVSVWFDVWDECKYRNLLPDWEGWSSVRHLLQ